MPNDVLVSISQQIRPSADAKPRVPTHTTSSLYFIIVIGLVWAVKGGYPSNYNGQDLMTSQVSNAGWTYYKSWEWKSSLKIS